MIFFELAVRRTCVFQLQACILRSAFYFPDAKTCSQVNQHRRYSVVLLFGYCSRSALANCDCQWAILGARIREITRCLYFLCVRHWGRVQNSDFSKDKGK